MPSYSSGPYELNGYESNLKTGEYETLEGKSWFHWCPNTHLHGRRRMNTVKGHQFDHWRKENIWVRGWYCTECKLFEGNSGVFD